MLSLFYLSSLIVLHQAVFLYLFLFVKLLPPLCQVQQPAESICTHCWTFFVAVLSILQKAFAFAFVFWWFVRCSCAAVVHLAEKKKETLEPGYDSTGREIEGFFVSISFLFFAFSLRDMRRWGRRRCFEMLSAFFSVWGSSCLEELSLGGDKYLVIPPSGCAEMTVFDWVLLDGALTLLSLSHLFLSITMPIPLRVHRVGWGCAIVFQQERIWLWRGWDMIPGSGVAD